MWLFIDIFISLKKFFRDLYQRIKLRLRPMRLDISVDDEARFKVELGNYIMCGMEQFRGNGFVEIKLKFSDVEGIEQFEHTSIEKLLKEVATKDLGDVQMAARTMMGPCTSAMVIVHNNDNDTNAKLRKENEELRFLVKSMEHKHTSEKVH